MCRNCNQPETNQNQQTMGVSCPNCKIPCTGCAGAKLTSASDGKQCCTKCVGGYEAGLRYRGNGTQPRPAAPAQKPGQVSYPPGPSR